MIESKLKEEEYLLHHPIDLNHESKWSKYGLSTLEVLVAAFGCYAQHSEKFNQEIAKRDGVNIGLRYLKHSSIQIRISASLLFSLTTHQTIGSEFRKNNDCLSILNEAINNPTLKLISFDHSINISPGKRLPYLHSGMLIETGLCMNCDIQHSTNPTDDNIDQEYSALPIIFDSFHHQNTDNNHCCSVLSIALLLLRLREFIKEEEEEKAQKILENGQSDAQIECKKFGQMISFDSFLLLMKSYGALEDVHYEINKVDKYDNVVENDSSEQALKRFLEDIEEDGLFENLQSLSFQELQVGKEAAGYIHREILNRFTRN
ncbi:MAG: hypothetical protein EZS28_015014 [Streblomastix strix]|uniref:Uncharacterized protein n=1 Tax=Streblomastix strix TaxID=222440 RepID=A0A5J4W4E1_9EUKA|nr:MAG: hypothetical protein EZS28_015014 [Streblomastix strix]